MAASPAEADLARSVREDLEAVMQLLALPDSGSAQPSGLAQVSGGVLTYLQANLGVQIEEAAPRGKSRKAARFALYLPTTKLCGARSSAG